MIVTTLGIAQVDTSVVIEDIVLSAKNIRTNHQQEESLDAIHKVGINSLAQSIEQGSNTYLKNYGIGSLATLSIRGGSAGQSLVLWNGLPLHSPMLGLLDMSLIPNNVTESISISKGGNSSLWGSGAISGVISMDSKKQKKNNIEMSSSVGSFGSIAQNTTLTVKHRKWIFTSKYNHESSDRDFEYEVSPTLPSIKQENARYKRNHFLQDIYYDINNRNQIAAHFWANSASTQIPPTTVQSSSEAYQDDAAIRSMINWKYVGNKSLLNAKIGYFLDHNDFYNPQTLTEALNDFTSLFADINYQYQRKNHVFSLGTTYNKTEASSQGYQGSVSESRIALFGIHQYDFKDFLFKSSLRKEYIEGLNIPLLPNFSVAYTPHDHYSIHTKISRNFRTPTLNDRYWRPGGDQALKPESGWSGELGLSINGNIRHIQWTYETNVFYRNMKDWILWSPRDNVPYWSAQNINNVISQGIEQGASLRYKTDQMTWRLNLKYDYISSTFQTALDLPKVNAGDQLFYTPKHTARAAIKSEYKNYNLSYLHMITGETVGVNEIIPSFQVGNTTLSYASKIRKLRYIINLTLNNIFNNRYFIIERRPIAGRNYNIGITIKY
jgi:iron complex outermembrane receptor protein